MEDILEKLKGGDLRSTGRADEVAQEVLSAPEQVGMLVEGLEHELAVVRMRAADALEKVSRQRPEVLLPFKTRLLEHGARAEQQEVRWHLAQIIPRLALTVEECRQAAEFLFAYLSDRSRIVQTMALQALFDLSRQDAALSPRVQAVLEDLVENGPPSVRARARKLLG
jgi:HEAT repeat protein